MGAQSHDALGQAGLLVGRDQFIRLDAPEVGKRIAMGDVSRAVVEMPSVARAMVERSGHRVNDMLLRNNAANAAV